ncbi:GGDEF domain-containing protein [Anaerolentibacter hominis]|uniref:GGDEF domain-containing protein n=1 Tax=Anaerolentibacter hominis TaxID=3079009 RepID=UPI0031B802A6
MEETKMISMKKMDVKLKEMLDHTLLFECYLLVDPETGDCYDYKDGEIIRLEQKCYEYWRKEEMCRNCPGKKVLEQKHPMFKLEFSDGRVYLVASVPIELGGAVRTAELIQDVSGSLHISDGPYQAQDIIEWIDGLNELAIRDSFTRLYNKDYAQVRLKRELENCTRDITIALLDIDDFKMVNDCYGHLMGDDVILYVVEQMKESTRKRAGWSARIGGDEFLLVFYQMEWEEASQVCKGLERQLKEHVFIKEKKTFSIEVSIGMARTEGKEEFRSLMERADQDMYRIKQRKRSTL